MTHEEFKNRLLFVKSQVLSAYELFEAYIYIYNKQASDVSTMNLVPGFFQLTLYAFLNQFVVILSRLYDDDSDSINLSKLRNCFEQSAKGIGLQAAVKKQLLAQIDELINSQENNVTKLKILRDKALAHNDKLVIKNNVWTENAQISIKEYSDLIETAYNIVCICLTAIDEAIPLRTIGIETDVDLILDSLKAALEIQ